MSLWSGIKRCLWVASLWAACIVALFGVIAAWNFTRDKAPPGAPMIETVGDDEGAYISEIVATTIRASLFYREHPLTGDTGAKHGGNERNYLRDVHAKTHGCVSAKFQVEKTVPMRFRYGVFKEPHEPYNATVRFSSGLPGVNTDTPTRWRPYQGDVRGMAVKIDLGLPNLPDDNQNNTTQDFVATTSPVFFIRTIDQYARFSAAFSENKFYRNYFFSPWWDPRGWHMRQLRLLASSLKPRPASLVTEAYYSGSAYHLGPVDYVKFQMRPCPGNKPMPVNDSDPDARFDYLRFELAQQAKKGAACFDFMIQPQVVTKNMPIEDTTVEWSEKDSPLQKVATIQFDPKEMNQSCEDLAFNPWHALEDQKPVGALNRLRRVVYQHMSDFRRMSNCERACGTECGKGADGKAAPEGCYKTCAQSCSANSDPAAK